MGETARAGKREGQAVGEKDRIRIWIWIWIWIWIHFVRQKNGAE